MGSYKHHQALGISTMETSSEIWPTIGPMFDDVMTGNSFSSYGHMFQLNKNGFLEDCYFDFSYNLYIGHRISS